MRLFRRICQSIAKTARGNRHQVESARLPSTKGTTYV